MSFIVVIIRGESGHTLDLGIDVNHLSIVYYYAPFAHWPYQQLVRQGGQQDAAWP